MKTWAIGATQAGRDSEGAEIEILKGVEQSDYQREHRQPYRR